MKTTSTIKELIARLETELENKKKQRQYLYEQIILEDVEIDKIDDIVVKIDASYLSPIANINSAIRLVKESYDDRISTGCSNNLAWTLVEGSSATVGLFETQRQVEIYEVVEDPNQYRYLGFYGAKYYQQPLDRDYGSNLLPGIVGNIQNNSNILSITSNNINNIEIGDKIIESERATVSISTIFPSQLPTVVGFGTTTSLGITTQIFGSVSSGSTVFIKTGSGSTSSISTSHYVLYDNVISNVVGFGTTTRTLEYYDPDDEITLEENITYETILLRSPIYSGIGTVEVNFNVGILTEFPSIFLSTISNRDLYNRNFNVIRSTDSINGVSSISDFDEDFDYFANPFNPLNIGTINSQNLGVGHSLYFINSGDPGITTSWNSNQLDFDSVNRKLVSNEPKVGAGRAEYYVGNRRWPVKTTCTQSARIAACDSSYAPKGTRVILKKSTLNTSRDLTSLPTFSYTNSAPGTNPLIDTYSGQVLYPGDTVNNEKAQNILNAEQNLRTVLSANLGIASDTVNLSKVLRKIRKDMQLKVFSYLQASSRLRQEIEEIQNDLNSLRSIDFSPYET